eukprot:32237-Eustigmatos_ZCMA.PRE.1
MLHDTEWPFAIADRCGHCVIYDGHSTMLLCTPEYRNEIRSMQESRQARSTTMRHLCGASSLCCRSYSAGYSTPPEGTVDHPREVPTSPRSHRLPLLLADHTVRRSGVTR